MDYQEALEEHKKDCRRCRERICEYNNRHFSCLQNTDIKAYEELMQYKQLGTLEEIREAVHCKRYFDDLYGKGLGVINWHLNGDVEPLDNFIDSARDWSEEE